MKVYAVVRGEKHQGGEIERIFSSRKKALTFILDDLQLQDTCIQWHEIHIEATKDNEVALIRGSLPYALNKFNKQNNSNIRITTRTVPDGIRVWRIA